MWEDIINVKLNKPAKFPKNMLAFWQTNWRPTRTQRPERRKNLQNCLRFDLEVHEPDHSMNFGWTTRITSCVYSKCENCAELMRLLFSCLSSRVLVTVYLTAPVRLLLQNKKHEHRDETSTFQPRSSDFGTAGDHWNDFCIAALLLWVLLEVFGCDLGCPNI